MKLHTTLLLMGVVTASTTHAQPYEIERYVIAGGGGTSSGGSFSVSGTIGQHDAGQPMAGGNFELTGGFWAHAGESATRLCADQNSDGAVTPTDFTAWIANYNANDLRADVNQNGTIEPTDFTSWIGAFNQGAQGPTCTP